MQFLEVAKALSAQAQVDKPKKLKEIEKVSKCFIQTASGLLGGWSCLFVTPILATV
jgi:hypothetical protein